MRFWKYSVSHTYTGVFSRILEIVHNRDGGVEDRPRSRGRLRPNFNGLGLGLGLGCPCLGLGLGLRGPGLDYNPVAYMLSVTSIS